MTPAAEADAQPGLLDRLFWGLRDLVGAEGWFARQGDRIGSMAFRGSDQATVGGWLEGRQGQALLLRPAAGAREDLWLVLGPATEPHGVSRALNRLRAERLGEGEAALLQADGNWQVWSPVQLPLLREPLQPSNLLSVLGNYASWSPLVFAVGLLGTALLSTLPALLVIVTSRRRRLR